MKAEITNKEKVFEPIELKITIESEEELCSLWHRFNTSKKTIRLNSSQPLIHEVQRDTEVWKMLDTEISENYKHLIK